jgi:hypothetical protein
MKTIVRPELSIAIHGGLREADLAKLLFGESERRRASRHDRVQSGRRVARPEFARVRTA